MQEIFDRMAKMSPAQLRAIIDSLEKQLHGQDNHYSPTRERLTEAKRLMAEHEAKRRASVPKRRRWWKRPKKNPAT